LEAANNRKSEVIQDLWQKYMEEMRKVGDALQEKDQLQADFDKVMRARAFQLRHEQLRHRTNSPLEIIVKEELDIVVPK
jgi:hypothetical protein